MRVSNSPHVVFVSPPPPSVRHMAHRGAREDVTASPSMPNLTPEPMNLSSAQGDMISDNMSVQTDDIDITVFDKDWHVLRRPRGQARSWVDTSHARAPRLPGPGTRAGLQY